MARRFPLASVPILLLAAAALLATACSRGPDEQALREELLRRLDTRFEDGLFTVASFRRTGSAPYTDPELGESGLFVYYDAELEFLRDYSLTSWRGLNLGTLAYVTGSTESGITGFRPGGNAQGEVLRVHGRLSFQRVGEVWQTQDEVASPKPEETTRPATLDHGDPAALLRSARALLERTPEVKPGSREEVIVDELQISLARIDLRIARLDGKLGFGAGSPPGTYYQFGSILSRYATEHGLPMFSYASEGSVENGSRLQSGTLDFGLVQSDVAEILYQGWAAEGIFPSRDLRSVASLWPEAVHVVTLAEAEIASIADLRGRRVAIGTLGSGSRFNAIRIGLAAGMDRVDIPTVREIRVVEAIAALERREVDAVFVTEAVPSPALQALAARRSVRFASIEEELLGRLTDGHFAYYPLTVPARTYPGQTEPFRTLGLASTLITKRQTPDEKVARVLELLLEGSHELSRAYYRAAFISRDTMRLGIAVPLHPGAAAYYMRLERESRHEGEDADEHETELQAAP